MLKRIGFLLVAGFISLAIPLPAGVEAMAGGDAPRMAKEELRERLGEPNLMVIDVRRDSDWQASDSKIRGSIREDYRGVAWAENYAKEQTLVLYCA